MDVKDSQPVLSIRLEWATEVTETSFYESLRKLPEAKTHLWRTLAGLYAHLKLPQRAFVRDLVHLAGLKAIAVDVKDSQPVLSIRLEWATEVTETSFYESLRKLPEAKTHLILGPNLK